MNTDHRLRGTERVATATRDPKIELQSLSQSLIRLGLALWRDTEIETAEGFLVMMRALVLVDKILRYACSPGEIHLEYLKGQIRFLQEAIKWDPNNAFKLLNDHGISVTWIGDEAIPGLGWKAIPTPLSGPESEWPGFRFRSAFKPESCSVFVPGSASILGSGSPGSRFKPVSKPGPGPCSVSVPNSASTFGSSSTLWALELGEERGNEERLLLNAYIAQLSKRIDRLGNLCSSLEVWKGRNLPRRLYWTLSSLTLDESEGQDPPVGLPLTLLQATEKTPEEHFQTLLGIWQHIIELKKQPKKDSCIGWLIKVNEFPEASPEASRYLRMANEKGLPDLPEKCLPTLSKGLLAVSKGPIALSRRLKCAIYPANLNLVTLSHSVLGRIHYGELDRAAAREGKGCPQNYFVKNIRSVRIDYGEIDSPNGLDDNPATQLLHRWCKYNHPNVVSLAGLQEMPCNGIGLVLPEMNKESLSEHLDAAPSVDRCKLASVCGQVSSGLAYLHRVGVVHGSLRAANILVSLAGEAIISDPLLLEENRGNNTHTRAAWLAPEVVNGECLTPASDVYSLGMTILEVISGPPVEPERNNDEPLEVSSSVLGSLIPERPEKSIPTNSKDGNNLWTLLSQCCSIDSSSRPITDWVAELMMSITQDGLRPFGPRVDVPQEESFELSDTESVSSCLSGGSFKHANRSGLGITDPNASPALLDPESRMMARKVLKQLATHGCENLTDHIDRGSFSVLPFCNGGFGDVYHGKLLSGLRVAVKTPHVSLNILEENPDYLKDVAREIHSWSKCDHPNVLHFLGLAEFRGQIGMVAPWM
ncbi:unnamed protein product [Rhizoctonia solani]|uniref:Protein kinase domain-containing protein n=1 Tax=Rhizoctonia solani TaxID=456999 RepID=A0A8H3BGR0_9AGAM|nr:unnamed protein product [Rhizoctonia solani]